MKQLFSLNKYFRKYRFYFFWGVVFILAANYLRILSPQVTGFLVDTLQEHLAKNLHTEISPLKKGNYDILVTQFIQVLYQDELGFQRIVLYAVIGIFLLALLSGVFTFLMRQTIIVMSRKIEYAQKNEIFQHYQSLDANFYKTHSTGDLMNRISEDVSKVRMYTGPAIMYVINLTATIGFCIFFMLQSNWVLTLYVLAPLPILAWVIYAVNSIIQTRSGKIQALLSDLTSTAQESYSGIRVIKSYVQEDAILEHFVKNSQTYKKNAVKLGSLEAIYFPSMMLLIGLSTLITIAMGCWYAAYNPNSGVTIGTITEFVIYVNMLTFPVSAIGWTASMIQQAIASQKRINEFLDIKSDLENKTTKKLAFTNGDIVFKSVSFTYPHTGIKAIDNLSVEIKKGDKVLILGRTGSGKSSFAQLLMHFYNPDTGSISIDNISLDKIGIKDLRNHIGYIPQDVFLFSDTIEHNIMFGLPEKPLPQKTREAAKMAHIHTEIMDFPNEYNTLIGERGVTLSGGQKQRVSIARALIKESDILIFDDCLSAVDAHTELAIVENLKPYLTDKTAFFITHRIPRNIDFDLILFLDLGKVMERGKHHSLMEKKAAYYTLYQLQNTEEERKN